MQSNSLVKIISQTEARLLKLARGQRYQEGLKVIQRFHEKYGPANEILMQKAFFLYHYAAALLYGDTKTPRQNSVIQKNYRQAIIICRGIIRKHRNNTQNKRILLNARLYLAQIYAMIGQGKRAQRFAQQTLKYQSSTLAAERAADVYSRTGNLVGAVALYKEAIKKAEDPAQKLMAQIGLAMTYKQMGKTAVAIKRARIASMSLKQAKKNTNITLLGEFLHAHFPNLDKS